MSQQQPQQEDERENQAQRLLLAHLDAEQARTYMTAGYFHMLAVDGYWYCLHNSPHEPVVYAITGRGGAHTAALCTHVMPPGAQRIPGCECPACTRFGTRHGFTTPLLCELADAAARGIRWPVGDVVLAHKLALSHNRSLLMAAVRASTAAVRHEGMELVHLPVTAGRIAVTAAEAERQFHALRDALHATERATFRMPPMRDPMPDARRPRTFYRRGR